LAVSGDLPACSLYFDYGRIINARLVRSICAPCAGVGAFAIDAFNRALPAAERRAIEADTKFGN
jgi:hypothetical protein